MKAKINLTIDEGIVPLAKRYARKMGKSVSELVESLLREEIEKEQTSFSEKWQGRFTTAAKDDTRYQKLSKRYQL